MLLVFLLGQSVVCWQQMCVLSGLLFYQVQGLINGVGACNTNIVKAFGQMANGQRQIVLAFVQLRGFVVLHAPHHIDDGNGQAFFGCKVNVEIGLFLIGN